MQGGLAVTFITPVATNSLTSVSDMNEKVISISVAVISAFFINPADVKARGVVTLSMSMNDIINPPSTLVLNVYNGAGVATFAVAAAITGFI